MSIFIAASERQAGQVKFTKYLNDEHTQHEQRTAKHSAQNAKNPKLIWSPHIRSIVVSESPLAVTVDSDKVKLKEGKL